MNTCIRIENVTKTFSWKKHAITALDDVSFEIKKGERLGLIGPNGAGKTTLLRLMLGLLSPDRGTVFLEGGKAAVACVLDVAGAYPDMTPLDNFRFFAQLYGLEADQGERQGLACLEYFDMADCAKRKVGELSNGQQKLVSLCRAMVAQPDILIVDELTATLDPGNQRLMINFLLERNQQEGMTLIFSSHHLGYVEEITSHLVLISRGQKCLDTNMDRALSDHHCYKIIAPAESAHAVKQRLNQTGLAFFPSGPATLEAIVLPQQEDRVKAALTEDNLQITPRPTTLDDLYQAYITFSNRSRRAS